METSITKTNKMEIDAIIEIKKENIYLFKIKNKNKKLVTIIDENDKILENKPKDIPEEINRKVEEEIDKIYNTKN